MDIPSILAALGVPAQYIAYVAAFLGVCAVVAANVPPPANRASTWGRIYAAISFLGQNYHHAVNANDPKAAAVAPSSAPTKETTR